MCYCGCSWEKYPHGPNEGCVCRKPDDEICPYDEEEVDEDEEFEDEDEEDEEEDTEDDNEEK